MIIILHVYIFNFSYNRDFFRTVFFSSVVSNDFNVIRKSCRCRCKHQFKLCSSSSKQIFVTQYVYKDFPCNTRYSHTKRGVPVWHLRNALLLFLLYKSHLCAPSTNTLYPQCQCYTISLSIHFQLQWRGNWWPILYLCLQARSASTSSFRSLSQVYIKIIIQI